MLNPVMSRDDWRRAKRTGRRAYVGWRVLPTALAMLVLAVITMQQSERSWFVLFVAPLVVLLAVAYWIGIYERSRANYEECEAP